MAPFPDEVDVFTGPHWRMKQLVGLYCEKLPKTNFSNNNDFRSFLQSLCDTFNEFKMHEEIENEYIIGLLQQRSSMVYNVHSDNKLSEMLSLFEKGLSNVKSEHEQLNYARQLKERLEAFTQDFLPHMKEEEEVFQPMLMQYFTYEELKDIKKKVIAQHCSQQHCSQRQCSLQQCSLQPWDRAAEVLKGLSLLSRAEELQKAFKYADHEKTDGEPDQSGSSSATHISQLPAEMVLRLFRYLSPGDLCRCSQVCRGWAELAKTGTLWKHLYPVHWARGDYYSGPPGDIDQEPNEEWVKSRKDEGQAYQDWDEDADVDESDVSGFMEDTSAISAVQQEKNLLKGIIQNLLPAVGSSVRSIILAYSSTVSSKMVHQILALCPNITHLDLTQTDITDSAFDCWSTLGACRSLEHLDLSGCENITDQTLKKLSVALGNLAPSTAFEKHLGRRARLLLGAPMPIALLDECQARPGGRKRQAIIFKPRAGGGALVPTRVWLLDPLELADIEDAAEWRSFAEGPLAGGPASCCCRRSRRRTHRTAFGASLLQHRYGLPAEVLCGHSACCSGDAALRTRSGPRCEPCSVDIQSGCFLGGLQCVEPRNRTELEAKRLLRFLSLSGCYQVTDLGLRALSQRGGLPALEHLNLSGCLFVTEVGLHELVSACPALNDEHFYYCDNINGPHADTASGCQNLQCGFRACCRSGE